MLENIIKGPGYYSQNYDEILEKEDYHGSSDNETISSLLNDSSAIRLYHTFMNYIGFYTSDIFGLKSDVSKIGDFFMACYAEDRFVDSLGDRIKGLKYLSDMIQEKESDVNLPKEEINGLDAIVDLYQGMDLSPEIRKAVSIVLQNQIKRHSAKNYSDFARATEAIGEQSGYLVYLFLDVPDRLQPKMEYFARRMGSIGNLLDDILDKDEDEKFFNIKIGMKGVIKDLMIMFKNGLKMASKVNWYVVSEFLIASSIGVYKLRHEKTIS
jgi:hypothetical protein